jgi:hypothetical protein
MRIFHLFLVLSLFSCLAFSASAPAGKRSFIGTQMGYQAASSYAPDSARSLIYYDPFDGQALNPAWEKHGNLDYYVVNRNLRVPVRTLKRSPKAGALVLNKPLAIGEKPVRISLDQFFPSHNPELSSALFLCPPDAKFDESGVPDAFIRYFKRSQVELVEVKHAEGEAKLVWARNDKLTGGENRRLVFEIDTKNISLSVNDSSIFSIKNPLPELKTAKAGLWVSTKGVSESGGNMVFDNFLLESLRGE